jgi:hypothetical protein
MAITSSPSVPSQSTSPQDSSESSSAVPGIAALRAAPPTWKIAVPAALGGVVFVLCVFVGLRVRQHRRRRRQLDERHTTILDLEKDEEAQSADSALEPASQESSMPAPQGPTKPRELAWNRRSKEQEETRDSAPAGRRDSLPPSLGTAVGTVLSIPDPSRDVVHASQLRALEKLGRERQQRAPANQPEDPFIDLADANLPSPELASVSAPVSPTDADSSTVVNGDTADLDLRSQVSLLRRRLLDQQVQLTQVTLVAERLAEEQRERGSGPTGVVHDVPPAYDDD